MTDRQAAWSSDLEAALERRLKRRATAPPTGWHDGTLYCYGGCGTRYVDFASDVILPTPLWNRIAVGHPFDETQEAIEREGRGGVLCPACIVARLAALPERTVIWMDIERPAQHRQAYAPGKPVESITYEC